jgi:hypothetical protein
MKPAGLPRLLEDTSAAMLRKPRWMPERLEDHLFPKKKPGLALLGFFKSLRSYPAKTEHQKSRGQ